MLRKLRVQRAESGYLVVLAVKQDEFARVGRLGGFEDEVTEVLRRVDENVLPVGVPVINLGLGKLQWFSEVLALQAEGQVGEADDSPGKGARMVSMMSWPSIRTAGAR